MVGLGCRWCAGVIHVVAMGGWSVSAGAWNRRVVYGFVEGSFLPVSLVDETVRCTPDHKESPSHVKTRSSF